MKAKFAVAASIMFGGTQAIACSYIVQTQLSFHQGSAELERSQIVKLSEWLGASYARFAGYKSASVEVGAFATRESEAAALAERRVVGTVRALRILLRTDLPVDTAFRPYASPKNRFGESNDFASIQLYPDAEQLGLPDCNPVPRPATGG